MRSEFVFKDMTRDKLVEALRQAVKGQPPEEAAIELLCRAGAADWLSEPEFAARYLEHLNSDEAAGGHSLPLVQVRWKQIQHDLDLTAFPSCAPPALAVVLACGALSGAFAANLATIMSSLQPADTTLLLTAIAHGCRWPQQVKHAVISGVFPLADTTNIPTIDTVY